MKFFYCLMIAVSITSCVAPRSIVNSGKVTPHKHLRVGGNQTANISTQTVKYSYDGLSDVMDKLITKDSIILDEQMYNLNKAVFAYALDPISAGADLYIRYGVYKKFDVGYKYASGTHAFDASYQFLGSTNTFKDTLHVGKMYGSIGLQYSSQDFGFPSFAGLNKIQNKLGFEFSRKEILIPIIFSRSFGKEEEYGCISYGLAYSHSFVKYSWGNSEEFKEINNKLQNPIDVGQFNTKKNYGAIGGFLNLKAGYRYVYFVASFNMYYQKYGYYAMLNKQNTLFEGFTFIPTMGLQFQLPLIKKKKA